MESQAGITTQGTHWSQGVGWRGLCGPPVPSQGLSPFRVAAASGLDGLWADGVGWGGVRVSPPPPPRCGLRTAFSEQLQGARGTMSLLSVHAQGPAGSGLGWGLSDFWHLGPESIPSVKP